MRRITALVLFTLGYGLMVLLDPAVSMVPALAAFYAGGMVLVREPGEAPAAARLHRR